jgi:hypothetical protein
MKNIMKNNRFDVIAISAIIISVLIVYRDLIFGFVVGTNDYGGNDLLLLHAPTLYHYGQALKEGVLLQWMPELFCGFPVMAEGQNGFLYPVNILLYFLFDFLTAMNIYHIIHPILMGIGVYYLIKKVTNDPYSALPGAIAAALCGSLIMGHTRHLGIYAIISLTPYLLLIIENFIQTHKVRYGLLMGLLLGLIGLIGHPHFAFIAAFIAFTYALLRLIFYKAETNVSAFRPDIKHVTIFILISSSIAIIIALPQLLSTYELFKFTERASEVTDSFRELGSLPFDGFMAFVDPYYWGNAGNHTFKEHDIFLFWEWFHYVGVLTLALALLGAFLEWRRSGVVKALVIIAFLSYLLALGGNLPIYKIFSFIPGVQNFRFPNRWLFGTELSIIILSGFGIKGLIVQSRKYFSKDLSFQISIIAAFIIFFDIFLIVGLKFTTIKPEVYFHRSGIVDKLTSDTSFFHVNSYNYHRVIALAFEMSKGWENDQSIYKNLNSALPNNLPAYHSINQSNAYIGLIPNYLAKLWGTATVPGIIPSFIRDDGFNSTPDNAYIRAMQLFGVKYIPTIYDIKGLRLVKDSSIIKLYEVPDPMPRAWVVDKLLIGPEKYFIKYLYTDSYDLYSHAFFPYENQVLPENSRSGKIEVLQDDEHYLKMKVETSGLAVISDTWYPRWKAKVNGKRQRVFRVNHSMRGVFVEKPNSILEMYYNYNDTIWLSILSYFAMLFSLITYILIKYDRFGKSQKN